MTTTDRVVKYANLGVALFGLVGVGLILHYGSKLKTQIDEIRPEVDAVVDWTNTSAARWIALDQFNKGKINVPQIVEPTPAIDDKSHRQQILIIPPSPIPTVQPSPTLTPTPKPKVPQRTVKRKKTTPTPVPVFNWFKHKK